MPEIMSDCCNPSGYQRIFSPKQAQRSLRRYDKKGLNTTARRIVDYLMSRGVEGHKIIEVGGGIGALHLELLKAGAATAVNVELSPSYGGAAAELLRREGLEGRVEQVVGDFTQIADGMEADDVIMNRVICCYPDMEKLMNAGLTAGSQFLGVTFPRDRVISRVAVGLENAFHRVRGVDFRAYIHAPEAILETARRAGFEVAFDDRDLMWRGVVFERVA